MTAKQDPEPGSDALLGPEVWRHLADLPEPAAEDRGERVEDPGEPELPEQ